MLFDRIGAVKFVSHDHVFNAAKVVKHFLALKLRRWPSALTNVIIPRIEFDLGEGRNSPFHRQPGGMITLGQLFGRGSV